MNRRQLLIDLATLVGCTSLAGMIARPYLERKPTARGDHSASGAITACTVPASVQDQAAAKAAVQRLEQTGFVFTPARFWERTSAGTVRCVLCPRFCELRPYERGLCRVRFNIGQRLMTVVYGRPCSVAVDPIEKKPVFHLLPGSRAFSIATAGCLLGCKNCQNWQISQANPEDIDAYDLPPAAVVKGAERERCASIAFTYTEPTIFYEYMLDTAKLAKAQGIRTVVISCGFINPEPLQELLPWIDVMKVDLKGFSERFYRIICGGRLRPVLDTLETLARSSVQIDVVTLVLPTYNDDPDTMRSMFRWLRERTGRFTSLFLSRFFPTYKLRNLPPPPVSVLEEFRELAMQEDLPYVYLGNVPGHAAESTYCHACGQRVVQRLGYQLGQVDITTAGRCRFCDHIIPGIWNQ